MSASATNRREASAARGYCFPPGLDHNLLWYAFRKFRPADPITLFQYLAEKHGDIAHYRLGPEHIVFINNPDYVREILVVQHENFIKERTQQRTKMLLGQGMITADGPPHRAQRRAAQPAFHRQRIAAYADTIADHTTRSVGGWTDGETLDIAQEMMRLTLGIVAATLFGTELGSETGELNVAVNQIMRDYTFLIALPLAELLLHFPVPQLRRFRHARSRLDATVYRLIHDHRSRQNANSNLLSMLMEPRETAIPTDDQLRDEILTILLAGYETVANALAWTFYLLSQNSQSEQRLHEELRDVLGGRAPSLADVSRLRYTEMALAESMRLYPPAWAMGRCARQDFSLGPWRFPARTTVLMSQYLLHRDPRYWHDPLTFRPERFAVAEESRWPAVGCGAAYVPVLGSAGVPRFCYFPFGAGPRHCIGESFAWMEGVLVIATIAQRWRLRLVPGHRVEPQPLITLRPKYGLRMTLELLRDVH